MLLREGGNLPITIVRPSIGSYFILNIVSFIYSLTLYLFLSITVLSAHKEPVEGWVDNLNGPTGIIAAAGKGFFRTMLCHGYKTADLVPVDTVINLMVVAAWKKATSRFASLFSVSFFFFFSFVGYLLSNTWFLRKVDNGIFLLVYDF